MTTREPLEIVSVERQDGTKAIVELSDGRIVRLTVQDLEEFAAKREDAPEDSPS